ncbi:uncharacterized protein LOC104004529 [Pan troglodytes]|uniref:uncharacterized protein LOC104004529 n=1 Tax=Pan troglodytes TaxID=9598 RepID=UPI0023F3C759|nr:uncharacterized protein LOC104004529 [Pan troglodytes]
MRMREAPADSAISDSHGCRRNQSPRLGKAGALRGSAWASGLRGPGLTSPGVDRNVSGCQESQRADQYDETTGRVPGKQRGIPASGLPGRCSGVGHVPGSVYRLLSGGMGVPGRCSEGLIQRCNDGELQQPGLTRLIYGQLFGFPSSSPCFRPLHLPLVLREY